MWNQDIICPHCSHVNEYEEEFENEDTYECICNDCSKYFLLDVKQVPIFRTR